ncbi:MAG TPA: NAD(P)/FAD-dependent oxidoreductase [Chitinophagaceae bacterium]|nr:NAD(P)/FAD-dependent oxidoreductase [Chitinophagaceae bacterium]
MKYHVIVIGAGVAGLTAAKYLGEAGYNVCLLEASETAGGRIATIDEKGFSNPVETGAEFIHGNLPLTFKLLKEAGISYTPVEGNMIRVQNGIWQNEELDERWDEFMKELNQLKTDVTILEFLNEHFFAPQYLHLRQAVQRFAEGFDLADISKASILSVKKEWKNIDKKQYRITGGYSQLVNYLLNCCRLQKVAIRFNSCVNRIKYHVESVAVFTTDNKEFNADKLIMTVSVGVLQSGTIHYEPALTDHAVAIQSLGFGPVIKFLLEFKTSFWNEFDDDIGFILSDEQVPTWWTQLPAESNLLTGWLGGANAAEKIFESDEALLQTALQSLSSIFRMPSAMLREELIHYKIINWQMVQHIKGGYSYSTLGSEQAIKVLSNPIEGIIFFAGEAIAGGDSQGTVESAIQNGYETAKRLIRDYPQKQP